MANLLRMGFMIGMLVVVALAAALAHPQWAEDLGLEKLHTDSWQAQLFGVQDRYKELQERDEALLKRLERKQAIVTELIAGRISLFEAAAQFRQVNEEWPNRFLYQPYLAGESEEESLCRQVIDWTHVVMQISPNKSQSDFVQELRETLRRHKEQYGMVVLPTAGVTH
jgi:hypothetical protein